MTDSVASRALYGAATASPDMNELMCVQYCDDRNFAYAGVEYGTECYCGNTVRASGKKAAEEDCNMPCAGNSYELCGGPDRMNVFHNDNQVVVDQAGPAHNAGPAGWGFMGCYTDRVAARTLTSPGQSEGGGGKLTVRLCTEACDRQGFNISGVEYSGECYCGES
jgi:hypothetical protein